MWAILGIPTTKSPINLATFISHVLPPLLCYFAMAVMAITSQTRALRATFWPVVALLSLRAVSSVVIVFNSSEPKSYIDLSVSASLLIIKCQPKFSQYRSR